MTGRERSWAGACEGRGGLWDAGAGTSEAGEIFEASLKEAVGVCLGAWEKVGGEGRWRRLSAVAL